MGGCQQSKGAEPMKPEEQEAAFDIAHLNGQTRDSWLERYRPDALADYTILAPRESSAAEYRSATQLGSNIVEHRCIGAMIGLAIGDALGAPLEFATLRYGSTECSSLGQEHIWEVHPDYDEQRPIKNKSGYNYFGLKPGQFTDDTSMALCLADSLLVCRGFNALDLRLRFLNWWQFGYNSAFRFDAERRSYEWCGSVGLGGNIGDSLQEFLKNQAEYTSAGNSMTSGNGSIMRLAPCAIYFHRDPDAALETAAQQSYTTHRGDEAAECCRLLAHILLGAFNAEASGQVPVVPAVKAAPQAKTKAKAKAKVSSHERRRSPSPARRTPAGQSQGPSHARESTFTAVDKRWLLDVHCAQFQSTMYSVDCLAKSCAETKATIVNQGMNFDKGEYLVIVESVNVLRAAYAESTVEGSLPLGSKVKVTVSMSGYGLIDEPIKGYVPRLDKESNVLLERVGWRSDRNWNWKDPDYKYSPSRSASDPDYIGSYCMDNLGMALHCVWSSESFSECLLKAANMCGDSDTVAAVAGQLAGAMYGASAVPKPWRQCLETWDGGDVALKASLLCNCDNEELLSRALRVRRGQSPRKASKQVITTKGKRAVVAAFRDMDQNKDGLIDRTDFVDVLTKLLGISATMSADDLLSSAGFGGDGKVDFHEFLDWVFGCEDTLIGGNKSE